MNKVNPPCLLLLFSLFVFACLILHSSSNSARGNCKSLLSRAGTNEKDQNLVELLKKVSMSDRSVVATVLDQAWARPGSVLELFLKSFQVGLGTSKFLNHLVIVTADDQAFQYCNSVHPHCFPLPTPPSNLLRMPWMHPDRLRLDRRTTKFITQVIELGYNLAFTYADVMWLQNPFLHFDPIYEITAACEIYMGELNSIDNKIDGGFFYVKSNEISIEFFRYWEVAMVMYPNNNAQSVFEIIKGDQFVELAIGLQVKYVDTDYFSSFCQPNKDMSRVHTMRANCCDDTESKVHDIQLVLDDWRNATTSSWRAPSKCNK